MPAISTNIKSRIKTILDGLVTSEVLGEVQNDDFNVGIFDREFALYPAAVISAPSIEGGLLTNRDNERTYTYEVTIVEKGENIASSSQIEELAEAIFDAFDNDPTLGGAANAGSSPATSPIASVISRGKTFVGFVVTIRAKAIKELSF